jgi:hypothetical protein
MQHIDPADGANRKTLFKKRIHRPWGSGVLTAEQPLIPEQLAPAGNAVMIGGFFCPSQMSNSFKIDANSSIQGIMHELKHKEQEILSLDHDLQIARALEETRKAESERMNESNARKSAEENALFAIQRAKLAVEQAHQAESKVLAEKKLRLELERTKKSMEERMHAALQAAEQKERERLMIDASKKELEEKLNIVKTQLDHRLLAAQKEADRKLKEAQEQISSHEKAKISAQAFNQKTIESARQTETARLALEEELNLLNQRIAREKSEQVQQTAELHDHIKGLEMEKKKNEENQALSARLLTQALEQAKSLESAIESERTLRKNMEQKLTESQVRAEESKRKNAEDRIMLMEQEIAALEQEKSRIEEKLFKTQRSIRNLEIMRLAED